MRHIIILCKNNNYCEDRCIHKRHLETFRTVSRLMPARSNFLIKFRNVNRLMPPRSNFLIKFWTFSRLMTARSYFLIKFRTFSRLMQPEVTKCSKNNSPAQTAEFWTQHTFLNKTPAQFSILTSNKQLFIKRLLLN